MDVVRYRAAAALAGEAVLRLRPRPYPVGAIPGGERNAVYIVCDVTGAVRYVGSTCGRPARHRLAEHLADRWRTRRWHEVWVIPISASASPEEVRRAEGRIGRYLHPPETRSLPAG